MLILQIANSIYLPSDLALVRVFPADDLVDPVLRIPVPVLAALD